MRFYALAALLATTLAIRFQTHEAHGPSQDGFLQLKAGQDGDDFMKWIVETTKKQGYITKKEVNDHIKEYIMK